jgi:hypothetical protein
MALLYCPLTTVIYIRYLLSKDMNTRVTPHVMATFLACKEENDVHTFDSTWHVLVNVLSDGGICTGAADRREGNHTF